MTLLEKAHAMNKKLKEEFAATAALASMLVSSDVKAASDDAVQGRAIALKAAPLRSVMEVRDWEVNMVTQPGDMVYDPDKRYTYLFTGSGAMTHSNPLFYPGSEGVYYWAIVPDMLDGVKVYPDISGIIVAVKHGEKWWNTDKTSVYIWNGVDNNACVWPPQDGNEWTKVDLEEEKGE